MKTIMRLVVATAAALFATQAAIACQLIEYFDANGVLITPLKPIEEDIAASGLSFVGTVVGYRSFSGAMIEQNIDDCRWNACQALALEVMSVVFVVEHAIEGTEAGQFYEEIAGGGDGDCEEWFTYGTRYLFTPAFAGAELLPDEPTPEQIAYWRSFVRPNPTPTAIDDPAVTDPDCLTPPEDILAALAPARALTSGGREIELPRDAFVARLILFRLDDSTLTSDTSPCYDQASPECIAFKGRIVSILVETETVISGERAVGFGELPFVGFFWGGHSCHLPSAGQRYLLGSDYYGLPNAWRDMRSPRALLTTPPVEAQLTQWREAARVGP